MRDHSPAIDKQALAGLSGYVLGNGPEASPNPSILVEIRTIQQDTGMMIEEALQRVLGLTERLVGKAPPVPQAGDNRKQEGARFSTDGLLGQAYQSAFMARDAIRHLHRLLDDLSNI